LTVRYGVAAALTLGTFAVGCGNSDGKESSSADAKTAATAKRAIAEIAAVRAGLDQALTTYRSGDKAAADRQVGDTYLQHFELVEGPLDKVDHVLKEKLEGGIREELRARIKAGAPRTEIAQLRAEIETELDQAEAALR
jgi:hypothetical protein